MSHNTFYRPEIEVWVIRYVLIWFILISSFVYLVFVLKLSFEMRVVFSFIIVFHLLVINGILESKKWAWKLEGLRLASLITLAIYFPIWSLTVIIPLALISGIYLIWKFNLFSKSLVKS